jgi:hypothetical protein
MEYSHAADRSDRPMLFLFLMRAMFGFSGLVALSAAALTRRTVSPTSLCIWDHVAAMLLLTLICSMVPRLVSNYTSLIGLGGLHVR